MGRLDHSCPLCQRKLHKTHLSSSDSSDKGHTGTHCPQCASTVNCTSISSHRFLIQSTSLTSQTDVASLSFLCPERTIRLCASTRQGISSCHFLSFHCRFVTPFPALQQFFVTLPYALTNFSTSFWNSVTELTPITNSHHNIVYTRDLITSFHIFSRFILTLLPWHHGENASSGCFSTLPTKYFWSCRTSGHSGLFHWNGLNTFHHFLELNKKKIF